MPKISALPTVTAITPATDKLVVVASGVTSGITGNNLGLFERGHPVASGGTRRGVPGVAWGSAASTRALTANTVFYAPFLVTDPVTVDACQCEVTTGAGTVARMGILSADTAWQPSAVIQDAGTIDPSTTGVKTASFTALVLQPGRYLTAIVTDGGTFRQLKGDIAVGEALAFTASPYVILHSVAAVGTGALGTTAWTSLSNNSTNGHEHYVLLRITGV